MIEYFLTIPWITNYIFWLGAYIYTTKKASINNLYIAIGLFIYVIGGIIYITYCLLNSLIAFAIGQSPFVFLDIKGAIINYKKWKNEKSNKNL